MVDSHLNDMTNKANEPPLHFPKTLKEFFTWIWNLCVSYPHKEIYIGDDDATGAFRHVKYNPNLAAMHSSIVDNWLLMSTGQTFGDTACPQNWEPIAYARRQHAQFLWHKKDIVERAAEYLPAITTSPDPTPSECTLFAQAITDNLNHGVFDAHGNRLPPKFGHHVDDCIYTNIKKDVPAMLSSSTISLYDIFGYPDHRVSDPLNREKLITLHSWLQKILRFTVNSRTMSFELTKDRRDILVQVLNEWTKRKTFLLVDAAKLHGMLESASQACRWARPYFFALQNALRDDIHRKYHKVKALE
jgi:hypothetical protein